MKLLFYIHSLKGGGAERVLCTLANRFAENGYDIYIATDTSQKCAYELHDAIKLINLLTIVKTKTSLIDRVLRYIGRLRNIRKIAKEIRPDIAISFIRKTNIEVILSFTGLGIPLICSEHTCVNRSFGVALETVRKCLYPFASVITVLTRNDLKLWSKSLQNVVYMPNPIKVTRSMGIFNNKRQKIILAAGRLDVWRLKGFDNLIRVWGLLCHDFPDWSLHIAGSGNKESFDYLQSLVNENNCKNIKLLGFRSDISDLMENSEIFVLSSRTEGLPMVLIEAMNAGCCCVSFNCTTGPSEIIRDGVSGILVQDQDVFEMTSKLRLVMTDDDYRHRLANNTLLSIDCYDTERILKRWNILFQKISKNNIVTNFNINGQ